MSSNKSSAWGYVGGSATPKQRAYIDRLASEAGGFCDGVEAAGQYFGYSRSKLGKKGLDVNGASQVIDWLKKKVEDKRVPVASEDPEVQALRKDAGSERDTAELRKIAGIE